MAHELLFAIGRQEQNSKAGDIRLQPMVHISTCSTTTISTRRSYVNAIDWTICMFCQHVNHKEHLCSVMKFNTSHDILNAENLLRRM